MTPNTTKYYQHRYGGIYLVDFPKAKSTVDKTEWVVYTHIWPFEEETYIRPYDEWNDGRFKEIDLEKVSDLFRKDRVEFQLEIGKARSANR